MPATGRAPLPAPRRLLAYAGDPGQLRGIDPEAVVDDLEGVPERVQNHLLLKPEGMTAQALLQLSGAFGIRASEEVEQARATSCALKASILTRAMPRSSRTRCAASAPTSSERRMRRTS